MPPIPPSPQYSKADARLIYLLSSILKDSIRNNSGSNCADFSVLSQSEINEIISLINIYINNKEFIDASNFIEFITNANDNGEAREIYLSNRALRGRARIMSTSHWLEFQTRLGLLKSAYPYKRTEKMSFSYFQKLEAQLLRQIGVHPNVIESIMELIKQKNNEIDELRSGIKQLRRGVIREIIFDPIRKIQKFQDKISDYRISTQRLAAAITLVSDVGVIFTSRDWGVAGTISGMAGAAIAASSD